MSGLEGGRFPLSQQQTRTLQVRDFLFGPLIVHVEAEHRINFATGDSLFAAYCNTEDGFDLMEKVYDKGMVLDYVPDGTGTRRVDISDSDYLDALKQRLDCTTINEKGDKVVCEIF